MKPQNEYPRITLLKLSFKLLLVASIIGVWVSLTPDILSAKACSKLVYTDACKGRGNDIQRQQNQAREWGVQRRVHVTSNCIRQLIWNQAST